MNKNRFSTKALVLSVCLMILWTLLGTGTTLAWFSDETPVAKNTFIVEKIGLAVSYKNDVVTDYAPVTAQTSVFNDHALYEPGYTQVVYLRVENPGEIDFKYKLSVDQLSYVDGVTAAGKTIHLPAYLRFGVLFADTEPELNREVARNLADRQMLEAFPLNQYSRVDEVPVSVDGCRYVAIIVWMPETVGNEANYQTGSAAPQVKLGMTVFAQQADAPLEP